jgi:DNA-binding NarL/FixJ family response regulator
MRIVIVSKMRALREALQSELVAAGFNGTVENSDFGGLRALTCAYPPDLLFVSAPVQDGIELVGGYRLLHPTVKVGVLAFNDRDDEFITWANIGISGYVEMETSAAVVVTTILRLALGETIFPGRLSAMLLHQFARRQGYNNLPAIVDALTRRELEVLELLADGMSNKQIARSLAITDATVKNHVHSVLDKLNLHSRGEAAAHFRRSSLSGRILGSQLPLHPPRGIGVQPRFAAQPAQFHAEAFGGSVG